MGSPLVVDHTILILYTYIDGPDHLVSVRIQNPERSTPSTGVLDRREGLQALLDGLECGPPLDLLPGNDPLEVHSLSLFTEPVRRKELRIRGSRPGGDNHEVRIGAGRG